MWIIFLKGYKTSIMQIVRCCRLIDCVVNSMNPAAVSKKDQICANLLVRGTNKTNRLWIHRAQFAQWQFAQSIY